MILQEERRKIHMVELDSADAEIILPEWIGAEVTDDPRYYNANLIAHPYTEW